VVGAGSAGAVIAARLTEDPAVSVLLLDSGGSPRHLGLKMPIAFLKIGRKPQFSWTYESEPESALGGRRITVWRGRVLGGSSSINGMIYTRGHFGDYDGWRQQGLEGWGYEEVLPYFRRLEDSWRGTTVYHATGGPIRVSRVELPIAAYDVFERSAAEAGHPRSNDPYGEDPVGVSRLELTVGGGERWSTLRGYLEPARRRPNLTIRTHALVTRVIIRRSRAVGVEYRWQNKTRQAFAARETILSAGALESPKLLMLSGVGPAAHLRAIGITPILDRGAVGANLQEHPIVPVVWGARGRDTFLKYLRWDRAGLAALQWLLLRNGPFASNACYASVYAQSERGVAQPDIQIVATAIGLDASTWFPALTPPPVHRYVAICGILHPRSRGSVRLRTSDPSARPAIQYNLLQDVSDLGGMVRAVRIARDIYARPPLQGLIKAELSPGSQAQSDQALEQCIRMQVGVGQHPVGTCRMGSDEDSVVDASLRVRGIESLRVADASIMPTLVGGNTNVPVIMIGEKAADLLRGKSLPPAAIPPAAPQLQRSVSA
jgi:choline dehydrogenase